MTLTLKLLVLLDLSSAFDAIDRSILHDVLAINPGIIGYPRMVRPSGRKQRVFEMSFIQPLVSLTVAAWVCVSRIYHAIANHLSFALGYADDTQIYFSFRADDLGTSQDVTLAVVEACVTNVRARLIHNRLLVTVITD